MNDKKKPDAINGKLNGDAEGDLNLAIGVEGDHVLIRFEKPIAMIGMTPTEAVAVAEGLIKHARAVAKRTGEILTVSM